MRPFNWQDCEAAPQGSRLTLELSLYHVFDRQAPFLEAPQVVVIGNACRDRFGRQNLIVDIHIFIQQPVQLFVLLAPLLDDFAGIVQVPYRSWETGMGPSL